MFTRFDRKFIMNIIRCNEYYTSIVFHFTGCLNLCMNPLLDDSGAPTIPQHLSFLEGTIYSIVPMPEGSVVFREHEGCSRIGFVMSGTIRVFKEHESGRSITLYRLEAGDSCILSMSCALSNPIHQATAVVESDAVVVTVPTQAFAELVDKSHEARNYVFSLFATRLNDIMMLLEEVVFLRMDERLLSILEEHRTRLGSNVLHVTHEQLAEEAGTAREVVTRLLNEFSRRGMIELARKEIRFLS
jgi:CRP/FNR family transcriptional regulator, anaerobic regulatory protein